MRVDDVNEQAVRQAVGQLGHRFQTKDVSEHPVVSQAHASFRQDRNYHATIGTYLSRNRDGLGLTFAGRLPPRGEIWARGAIARRQALAPITPRESGLARATASTADDLSHGRSFGRQPRVMRNGFALLES